MAILAKWRKWGRGEKGVSSRVRIYYAVNNTGQQRLYIRNNPQNQHMACLSEENGSKNGHFFWNGSISQFPNKKVQKAQIFFLFNTGDQKSINSIKCSSQIKDCLRPSQCCLYWTYEWKIWIMFSLWYFFPATSKYHPWHCIPASNHTDGSLADSMQLVALTYPQTFIWF